MSLYGSAATSNLYSLVSREGCEACSSNKVWLCTSTAFDRICNRVKNWSKKRVYLMQVQDYAHGKGSIHTVMLQYDSTLDGIQRYRRIAACWISCIEKGSYNPGADTSTWPQGCEEGIVQLIKHSSVGDEDKALSPHDNPIQKRRHLLKLKRCSKKLRVALESRKQPHPTNPV